MCYMREREEKKEEGESEGVWGGREVSRDKMSVTIEGTN